MDANPINEIVLGTILVMTTHCEFKEKWVTFLKETLELMSGREDYWKAESEFFNAVYDLILGKKPQLENNHQYASQLLHIQLAIYGYEKEQN